MVVVVSSGPPHRSFQLVILQKVTSELAGVEQQKKVLEMELEQWKRVTLPPQPAPPLTAAVNTECSCRSVAVSDPANPACQNLEAKVKQLQAKLKVSG